MNAGRTYRLYKQLKLQKRGAAEDWIFEFDIWRLDAVYGQFKYLRDMVKRHTENTYILNNLLLRCENVCLLQQCKCTDRGGKKRI